MKTTKEIAEDLKWLSEYILSKKEKSDSKDFAFLKTFTRVQLYQIIDSLEEWED